MHDENPEQAPQRRGVAEGDLLPADTLFVRLRHQAALLAAAEGLLRDAVVEARWALLLHDYAMASDRIVTVHGDAEAATLGWLRPRGIIALLVTEDCSDEHVVEHLAAALAAMNAVTLSVDDERSERLAPLITTLARLLPDAFAELPSRPSAHYPVGATAAVLSSDALYRMWAPPVMLTGPARDEADRLEVIELYGRLRQLEIRPE
jgi:hypothetical protein